MKELDIVVLQCDLPSVSKGTSGTIVFDYLSDAYEVEFTKKGVTIAVETVAKENLKLK